MGFLWVFYGFWCVLRLFYHFTVFFRVLSRSENTIKPPKPIKTHKNFTGLRVLRVSRFYVFFVFLLCFCYIFVCVVDDLLCIFICFCRFAGVFHVLSVLLLNLRGLFARLYVLVLIYNAFY